MARRLELQAKFLSIVPNVYFQPPESIRLMYPCIIYERDDIRTVHADNKVYQGTTRYLVKFISRNPDDPTKDQILELPMCVYSRYYAADDLNHDLYNLFF